MEAVENISAETTTRPPKRLDWVNATFLLGTHIAGVFGVLHLVNHFHWGTVALALAWGAMCGLSITGGYHRLFSHPTYKANALLRAFYLAFGAASVQNSAMKWSADHRIHHAKTDSDEDPYNIRRGFWWAHIGWVLFGSTSNDTSMVGDLEQDPLVRFQHKFYIPLAFLFAAIIPGAIGALWGDALGGVLVAGFLRLTIQYHATFSVNSFAHMIGTMPYSRKGTARDSFFVALITMGEGYHNFHHRFPVDYRNGVRWFHFDPTKWFVWTMSKVGVTRDLRETSPARLASAREQSSAERAA
jgi:stearoyl-CoA desaturase (delta-9 desaturase)